MPHKKNMYGPHPHPHRLPALAPAHFLHFACIPFSTLGTKSPTLLNSDLSPPFGRCPPLMEGGTTERMPSLPSCLWHSPLASS